MSPKRYINQILEPVEKPYLLKKQDFVMKHDRNNGHIEVKNYNIIMT